MTGCASGASQGGRDRADRHLRARDWLGGVFLVSGAFLGLLTYVVLWLVEGWPGDQAGAVGTIIAAGPVWFVAGWWNKESERIYWEEVSG